MSATILVGYDPRARDRSPVELGVTLAELNRARLIIASVQAGTPITGTFPGTALPFAVEPADDDLVPDCSDAIAELKPDLGARHAASAPDPSHACASAGGVGGFSLSPLSGCGGPPRPATLRCSSSVPASAAL